MNMKMSKKEANEKLKPFSGVMQICPKCGKIDAYKDDKHNCLVIFQRMINSFE